MSDSTTSPSDTPGSGPPSSGPSLSGPVVCGVDGSPNAHRAIDVASALAANMGVDVVAVHALGLMSEIDGEHVPSSEHRDDIEARMRERWCAPLRELGDDRWSCRLVDGPPSDVLLTTADEVGASFIVVGARGIGGHPDLMVGSTSHQVIHRSHCSTVVVPPEDRPVAGRVDVPSRESI